VNPVRGEPTCKAACGADNGRAVVTAGADEESGVTPVKGGDAVINRDAHLLPASEAILVPADTSSLDFKSPTVFPVIRFAMLAIVSNIPPPPTT
jgi:hypothetical protein